MRSKPAILIAFLDADNLPVPLIGWDGATGKLAVTEKKMPLDEATISEDAWAVALAIRNGQTHYLRKVP
jgi:hypothetical protein